MTAYGDTGYISSADSDLRRATGRIVTTVVGPRRLIRVRKSSARKLRDLPELDLRTPSGRLLPY